MRNLAILTIIPLAMACAPMAEPGEPAPPAERSPGEESPCKADNAGQFIGQTATSEVGQRIIAATGARMFQWVGPNMAVTMDYRPDRVRVGYDEAMRITSVRCG